MADYLVTHLEETQQPILIFLHIPKTAGSTLKRVLVRQYGRDGIFSVGDDDPGSAVDRLHQLPHDERREIRVIHGHMAVGIHERLHSPALYFTMLRHPVDRIISHYYYVRRRPHHYLQGTADAGMTLKEYVETGAGGRSRELDNGQTRLLSGPAHHQVEPGQCTEEMLERAKENLDVHFDGVGIAERFDESLLLFRQSFGWKIPFYVRRNVTPGRPRAEDLDDAALRSIRSHNELDLALYEYARLRLDERIREAGPSFPVKLRTFRGFNSGYNRLRSLRHRFTPAVAPREIERSVQRKAAGGPG